jgi:hypothetical protein
VALHREGTPATAHRRPANRSQVVCSTRSTTAATEGPWYCADAGTSSALSARLSPRSERRSAFRRECPGVRSSRAGGADLAGLDRSPRVGPTLASSARGTRLFHAAEMWHAPHLPRATQRALSVVEGRATGCTHAATEGPWTQLSPSRRMIRELRSATECGETTRAEQVPRRPSDRPSFNVAANP